MTTNENETTIERRIRKYGSTPTERIANLTDEQETTKHYQVVIQEWPTKSHPERTGWLVMVDNREELADAEAEAIELAQTYAPRIARIVEVVTTTRTIGDYADARYQPKVAR